MQKWKNIFVVECSVYSRVDGESVVPEATVVGDERLDERQLIGGQVEADGFGEERDEAEVGLERPHALARVRAAQELDEKCVVLEYAIVERVVEVAQANVHF